MKTYWKTIPEDFTSNGHRWEMNKWFKVDGEIQCCKNGFHYSPTIMEAWGYVTPGWVSEVEVRGDRDDQGDKSACREMRLIRRAHMDDVIARKIAIYAAELALPIFEEEYPDDKRPRNAIETAKKYLRGKATKEELDAARDAAWDAAWEAASASASASARDAAWDAAWEAARDAIMKKIHNYAKGLLFNAK